MATLTKRRRSNELSPIENRMITPWSNSFIRPLGSLFFRTDFEDLNNLLRFEDVFNDDFSVNDNSMPL